MASLVENKAQHNRQEQEHDTGGVASAPKAERRLERYLQAEEEFSRAADQGSVQGRHRSCIPNTFWREMVCKWAYDVVDMLDEARSVVYVAMNVLDRYCAVAQGGGPLNEKTYEHASMTALFLAIRTAGSCNLEMTELIHMSRDSVQQEDIIATGKRMLNLLTWGPRLITPIEFVHAMLDDCLPSSVKDTTKNQVLEAASFLVEIAVCDMHLSRFAASQVAFAAILNAAQADDLLTSSEESSFCKVVEKRSALDHSSRHAYSIRRRLDAIYNRIEQNQQDDSPNYVSDDEEDEVIDTARRICSRRRSLAQGSSETAQDSYQSKIGADMHRKRLYSPENQEEQPSKHARRFSLTHANKLHRR